MCKLTKKVLLKKKQSLIWTSNFRSDNQEKAYNCKNKVIKCSSLLWMLGKLKD